MIASIVGDGKIEGRWEVLPDFLFGQSKELG